MGRIVIELNIAQAIGPCSLAGGFRYTFLQFDPPPVQKATGLCCVLCFSFAEEIPAEGLKRTPDYFL